MRDEIIKKRGYPDDISGSDLSLKIASYPSTANYIADRLQGHGATVCELCCGIGVSLKELAKSFEQVVGVDNDRDILADCEANLRSASVKNYKLLHGDVSSRKTLSKVKADVVLYDIPYWSTHEGQVNPDGQNPDLPVLIENIRQLITHNIVVYAPAYFSFNQAQDIFGACEYVAVYLNGKYDRNFVFLGDLIEKAESRKVEL